MFMDNSHREIPEYTTFTRSLDGYKWFKPIITALVAGLLYVLFQIPVIAAALVITVLSGVEVSAFIDTFRGGYDGFDAYSLAGTIVTLGNVAAGVPAILLAAKITKERPIKTFNSSRGGWNWRVFFVGLIVALAVNGLPQVIIAIIKGGLSTFNIRYSIGGFIIFLILLPFQCLSEEYTFRSVIMQTVGGWTRIPIVAILVQALIFALLHPYNLIGRVGILINGIFFGLAVWYTAGIEAGAALHIINNFFSMLLSGLSMTQIDSEVNIGDFFEVLIMETAFLIIIIILNRKFHWFEKSR